LKDFWEKFKIERKVFDRKTLLAIFRLMNKGYVKTVESLVKEGKESCVLSAKDKKGNWVALKVYRVEHCDFKSMWKYLVSDPRFFAVRKDRRSVVYNWCKREFKNLKIAFNSGVWCPEPIAFFENVLVMSFIGEEGKPAPRLIDLVLSEEDAKIVYEEVIENLKKLIKAKLIHSDLSPYNILLKERPYFIDFSQAVTFSHPLAKDFLERDLKNINSHFQRIGIDVKEDILEDLNERIR